MLKAAREAKLNTTWTDPNPAYSEILTRFVAEVLESPDAGPFLNDFLPFQRRIARIGIVHSLAQTLLKIASPGIPDIYQGCELWDLSLVDPDNRRPVDYEHREQLLSDIQHQLEKGTSRADLLRSLISESETGAVKLYLIWTALNHRKENLTLYQQGAYRPIDAEGEHKVNIVAFARYREGRSVVAIAPRLVSGLMGDEALVMPIGREVWKDTRLIYPETPNIPRRWRDLLSDRVIELQDGENGPTLPIGEVFEIAPFALLVDEPT